MKRVSKGAIRKACVIVGACLLAAAVVLLSAWQVNIRISEKKAKEYVDTIYKLIPKPQGAVVAQRSDNTMPALSVDGKDFVGILEMPRYESAQPVCASWGSISKTPCRFSGSIYDRTMLLGATTQKGQYDFYREICVGDSVLFTDMAGNRYSYAVTDVSYTKSADRDTLYREDASLTLFIKNVYAVEYIIVYCDEVA